MQNTEITTYKEVLKTLLEQLKSINWVERWVVGLNAQKTGNLETAIYSFHEYIQRNKKNKLKIEDLNQILELTDKKFKNYILQNTFLLQNGINQVFKTEQKDENTEKFSKLLSNLNIDLEELAPNDINKQKELNALKIDILLLKKHQNLLTKNKNSELENLSKNTENLKAYQTRINYLNLLDFDVILEKLELLPTKMSEKIKIIKEYFETRFWYKLNKNKDPYNKIEKETLNLSTIIFNFSPENLTDFSNQFKTNILEKINNLNHNQFVAKITSKDEEFLSFLIANLFETLENRTEILDVFYQNTINHVITNFENYLKSYQTIDPSIKNEYLFTKFIEFHEKAKKNQCFLKQSLEITNETKLEDWAKNYEIPLKDLENILNHYGENQGKSMEILQGLSSSTYTNKMQWAHQTFKQDSF